MPIIRLVVIITPGVLTPPRGPVGRDPITIWFVPLRVRGTNQSSGFKPRSANGGKIWQW
jgi:hypothetical protein